MRRPTIWHPLLGLRNTWWCSLGSLFQTVGVRLKTGLEIRYCPSDERGEQSCEPLSDHKASPSLVGRGFMELGSGEHAEGHTAGEYQAVRGSPLDNFELENSDFVFPGTLGVQGDRASGSEDTFGTDDVGVPGRPVLEVELSVPDGLRVCGDVSSSFEQFHAEILVGARWGIVTGYASVARGKRLMTPIWVNQSKTSG